MNWLKMRVSVTYWVASGNNVFRSRCGSRHGQMGESSPLGDCFNSPSPTESVVVERDIQRAATMNNVTKRAARRILIAQPRRFDYPVCAIRFQPAGHGNGDLKRHVDDDKTSVFRVYFDYPRSVA